MAVETTTISDFLTTIDRGVVSFFTGGAASISQAALTPFTIILTAYVSFWWILVAFDYIEEPIKDGLKRIVRIIFVVAFAFGTGWYNRYIAQVVYGVPDELAALFIGGSHGGVNSLIDNALEQGHKVAIGFKDLGAGWSPGDAIGLYLTYLIVLAFTGIVCACAAAFLLIAHLSLGLMIAIGPAAIICYLFRATRSYFDGWVKQVVTLVLSYVLVVATISLMYKMFSATLVSAAANPSNGFSAFIPALIVGFCCIFMIIYVAVFLARGIASGWHLDSPGIMAFTMNKMAAVGGFAGRSARAAGRGSSRLVGRAMNGEQRARGGREGNRDQTRLWPNESDGNADHSRNYHHHHPQLTHRHHSHPKSDDVIDME